MSKRGTNQQSTTSGGSGDGSAPVRGLDELHAGGGTRQRQHPVVQAGFSTSNFGTGPAADDYRRHAEAAAAAARAVNAGDPDGSGPAPGYDAYVAGRGSKPVSTCADPSSLASHTG